MKTGPDRPVGPGSGAWTGPVRVVGPFLQRTGVEPVNRPVGPENRPVGPETGPVGPDFLIFFYLFFIFFCFLGRFVEPVEPVGPVGPVEPVNRPGVRFDVRSGSENLAFHFTDFYQSCNVMSLH